MRLGLLSGAAAITLLVFTAAPATAATKSECTAAYEQTQIHRKAGKLRAAREQALLCAQDACPGVIRRDCARWLGEVEASLPTMVFDVHDELGQETLNVRVFLDGEPLGDKLDGKAVPVDPGEHALRFERPGVAPIEQTTVIHEGDKLRRITASFAKSPPPPKPPVVVPPRPRRGPPVLGFVLGGVGVLGLGGFATFGLLGLGEKGRLEDRCAPHCSKDEVAAVRTKLLVADISLGVGVAFLGAATIVFLTAPSSAPPGASAARAISFDLMPFVGGGLARIRGNF